VTPKKTGGQPDKRRAILDGALALFARDGYSRASLDAIAAEAGVSNRTIYNHFADKAELFRTVIRESTRRAADTIVDLVDRHLAKIVDLEADLVGLGLAVVVVPVGDLAAHFALVGQIKADAGHIPPATLENWRRDGPDRVQHALADRLGDIAERGLLTVDDPFRAAGHFLLLTSAENLPEPSAIHDEKERAAMVAAGTRAFLRGYRA